MPEQEANVYSGHLPTYRKYYEQGRLMWLLFTETYVDNLWAKHSKQSLFSITVLPICMSLLNIKLNSIISIPLTQILQYEKLIFRFNICQWCYKHWWTCASVPSFPEIWVFAHPDGNTENSASEYLNPGWVFKKPFQWHDVCMKV